MPLFCPFRALGYITEATPFSIQRRGRETFVTASVGKAWQIFNCAKLSLVFVGPQLEKSITSLAAWRDFTFAAHGRNIAVFNRANRVATWDAHVAKVLSLFVFGDYLISIGADRRLLVWDAKTAVGPAKAVGEFSLPATFTPTTIVHPDTYLNKVLLGSEEGRMQLWNVSSGQLVYEFAGWGCAITALAPSPALDVVAVGCADGLIHVHNLKFDEEVMTLTHGTRTAVTALSFRTDGQPFLAAGGSSGVITIWNLEKRKLQTVIKDAHDAGVVALHFFANEPVLLSSGADNSLKMWIFDSEDGEGRLLRFRSGHSAPPTCIQYYGSGRHILSAGQDRAFRVFSTIQDHQSRELSQGHVKKRAKRLKVREEEVKLTRVVGFASAEIRARDWCNVVTCHDGDPAAYTWRLENYVIGEHVLRPPGPDPTPVKSCTISACGNFAIVGTAGGRIERFNLQSGLHRESYQMTRAATSTAHKGAVVGLGCDACNKLLVSAGYDGTVKVWDFKERTLNATLDVSSPLVKMVVHRGNGLAAVASDDLELRVFDVVAERLVRRFPGHSDRITDVAFSEDGRWLLSTSMDKTMRVWDVVAASALDTMRLDAPATALSLAPSMDMLATTHVGRNGIYLWVNQLMYGGGTDLEALAHGSGSKVRAVAMPTISTGIAGGTPGGESRFVEEGSERSKPVAGEGGSREKEGAAAEGQEASVSGTVRQLEPELITLAMLPRAQVQNIVNLDIIKVRNKPIAPPKKPERAPFFLPTLPTLEGETTFAKPPINKAGDGDEVANRTGANDADTAFSSRIFGGGALGSGGSEFSRHLHEGSRVGDYSALVELLRRMGPSELDAEVRSMEVVESEGEALQDDIDEVGLVLDFLCHELSGLRNFELLQAFMHLFLEVHGEVISKHQVLQAKSRVLLDFQAKAWRRLDDLLQNMRCMVGFLSNAQ